VKKEARSRRKSVARPVGDFADLENRLASFAAMARFAASFRGPAKAAVRLAMRRERRRVLVGGVPWEFTVRPAMERLRLLPAAPCTRSGGGSAPRT
jgi:hypothetical protein